MWILTSEWHLLWPLFEVFLSWTLGLFFRSSSKSSSDAKGAFFKLGLDTEEVRDRLSLAQTFSYTVELCLLGDLKFQNFKEKFPKKMWNEINYYLSFKSSSSGSSTGGILEAAAASSGKTAGIIHISFLILVIFKCWIVLT